MTTRTAGTPCHLQNVKHQLFHKQLDDCGKSVHLKYLRCGQQSIDRKLELELDRENG